MQHQVTEFLAHVRVILAHNSLRKFKGLLDSQATQGLKSLHTIPWALLAKFIHDIQQSFKRL